MLLQVIEPRLQILPVSSSPRNEAAATTVVTVVRYELDVFQAAAINTAHLVAVIASSDWKPATDVTLQTWHYRDGNALLELIKTRSLPIQQR